MTFAEWDAFVAARRGAYKPEDVGWGRGDRPVINVSWYDILTYVAWLRQVTRKDYRLPSEAEWEYAARAGTQTPFWWGSSVTPYLANYYYRNTLPVKSFEPNPWGLYQVHGNVWEWVVDGWHGSYADKPEAIKANGGAWTTEGSARVLRGGSWSSPPWSLRSAYRNLNAPGSRNYFIGFRVARTLDGW